MAVVAGNMIVGVSAWLWAHRRARAHAIPHSEVRVASLVPRDTSLPGGSLFASGPFLILLITAVLVVTRWDQVPEGSRMTRALGPLALGALYVVIMLTMAVSLSRRTRQIGVEGMAAALEQRFRRLNVLVLVLADYGMAMMLSAVTLESIPAFGVTLSARLGFLLLPLMLFNFGVAFWMFRVGQGGQRAVRRNRATGHTRRRDTRTMRGSWGPVLLQPERPGHLGRKACRPWLHAQHRQLEGMVTHWHDVGADDCRPFPVLRLRLNVLG